MSSVGKYRWFICALLFFATTINYIDRQILSLIKEILDVQLKWTNTEFGYVNSAFQISYAFGLLGFGWFIDRFGTKIGYAISISAWSLAAMGHALVGSFQGFFAARIALGIGEGGNFPAAIKTVANWFPKGERAFATSIFNSGANVGAIIAPALVPAIAYTLGWHYAFIFAGAAGFIWVVVWWLNYDLPDQNPKVGAPELALIKSDRDEQENIVDKPSWLDLLRHRQTWSFVVGKLLTDPIWWFFLIWLPDFFKKTYDLNIKKSWVHLVLIYAFITVLSIFGGWVTGYLTRRGWSVTRARKTGLFIFALCVVPIYFATSLGIWPAVFLIALAGAAHQAWSANLFTTVSDMFPKSAIASVVGIGSMAGALTGACFPIICGMVLDRFKLAGDEAGAYTAILHYCAFSYLVAFGLNHLLAPKFTQIRLPEAR